MSNPKSHLAEWDREHCVGGHPFLLVKYENETVRERAQLAPAKKGDCGLDLFNASSRAIFVVPGRSVQIPAGIRVKIPDGCAGLVRARSSTFHKRGLFVVEGTIDSGYTGQIFTHVWNPGLNARNYPVVVDPWERLSQLIIVSIPKLIIQTVDELPKTERGDTGFGSTGR